MCRQKLDELLFPRSEVAAGEDLDAVRRNQSAGAMFVAVGETEAGGLDSGQVDGTFEIPA